MVWVILGQNMSSFLNESCLVGLINYLIIKQVIMLCHFTLIKQVTWVMFHQPIYKWVLLELAPLTQLIKGSCLGILLVHRSQM